MNFPLGSVLADLDVLPLLNPVLLSEEEGVEKPSFEMFRRACERAGVTADQVVHVGDELRAWVHLTLLDIPESNKYQRLHWRESVRLVCFATETTWTRRRRRNEGR